MFSDAYRSTSMADISGPDMQMATVWKPSGGLFWSKPHSFCSLLAHSSQVPKNTGQRSHMSRFTETPLAVLSVGILNKTCW